MLGIGFDVEIYVHRGAGAYICGEETGLIESLEGKRAYPRIKPPYFPAVLGLYMCPTIVNNVETLCHVKHIIAMGGAEYARIGRPNNTGTRIVCVSGDVVRPGYFEIEVGALTMGQVINEMAGGPKPGRKIKAVIPGGSSAKVLRAGDRFKLKEREVSLEEIPMDFDSLAAAGSMAGSGGVIVMDDSRDMVWALNNINEFYAHESCGQCTPCREGSLWMKKITDRMLSGGGVTQDPGNAEERGRQHRRPNHLRLRRSLRLADPKFPRKIPRRIRRARAKAGAASPAAGIHAGGTDRRRRNPHRAPRLTIPAGKKPARQEPYESGKQENRKRFAQPRRDTADHRCCDHGASRAWTGIS